MTQRDSAVGWTVVAVTVPLLVAFGAEGDARWPWLGFVLAAAAAYLLLLIPACQAWVGAQVARRPRLAVHVPLALALYGMVVTRAVGSRNTWNLVAWPVCVGVAVAVLGRSREQEPPPWRLLVTALALGALAGVWDRGLQLRVPGGQHLSLAFVVALVLALFLLRVMHPLRTFDVRLGLSARQLALALGAVAVLAAVAIPLGFAMGFLRIESRWLGPVPGAARILGLVLFVGMPEELLFRGVIQEAFTRIWNPRVGLLAGSLVFGLLHALKHISQPNWPYGLLATLAGLTYGWVYQRTGKLAAAAVTHGMVDWIWGTFLGA